MSVLEKQFFLNDDVVAIAHRLIGKVVYSKIEEEITAGVITETEAYSSINDKASHAFKGKRSPRNEAMYLEGGSAYVYICYGIHYMLNIVTNHKNIPDAVLIRSIQPLHGISAMERRRNLKSTVAQFSNGPGKVCSCLAINKKHNGIPLTNETVWIEDQNIHFDKEAIMSTPRIGIDYAEEDAELMYRFVLNSNEIKLG